MARIKIADLPADMKISPEEMKKIMGGMTKTDLTARAIEEDPWHTLPNPLEATGQLRSDSPLDALDYRNATRKINF